MKEVVAHRIDSFGERLSAPGLSAFVAATAGLTWLELVFVGPHGFTSAADVSWPWRAGLTAGVAIVAGLAWLVTRVRFPFAMFVSVLVALIPSCWIVGGPLAFFLSFTLLLHPYAYRDASQRFCPQFAFASAVWLGAQLAAQLAFNAAQLGGWVWLTLPGPVALIALVWRVGTLRARADARAEPALLNTIPWGSTHSLVAACALGLACLVLAALLSAFVFVRVGDLPYHRPSIDARPVNER
jgi:hypothetical protein